LLCRPELGQTELLGDILPTDIYGHFATHCIRITAHNIGEEMGPFLELDYGDHVWEISFKSGMVGLMINNEAEDLSFPAGAYPLRLVRITQRTDNRGRPAHMTALRALLKSEFVIPAGVPKGLGVCVDFW
jgi:hypothetical protein